MRRLLPRVLLLSCTGACAPRQSAPLAIPVGPTPEGAESGVAFGGSPPARPAPPALRIDASGQLRAADAAEGGSALPLGPLLDIELVDADLHGFLRLISEVSGLDFVVDGAVRARVTVRLQRVAWNHALFAVLQAEGLALRPLAGGGFQVSPGAAAPR